MIINTKDFITKKTKDIIDSTMKIAVETKKDTKEQQKAHVSLTSTIVANIMYSVWCTIKVMDNRKTADEYLNNLFSKIRKSIKLKLGEK